MVAEPTAIPVIDPLMTVAMLGLLDVHTLLVVTFWLVPSAKLAVAIKLLLVPTLIVMVTGVILRPVAFMVSADTVRFVFPVILPRVALIEVVPAATVEATPLAEIVAMFGNDEFQVAVLVTSAVVPSE